MELGLECAFPKPACSLEARDDQPAIREFQRIYRVGRPKIVIQSRDGVIREARVVQSAPCGNTYYVAYNLAGQEIGKDLNERVTAKYWHSFPCVGSMATDPELGDSILHKGGYLHYSAVDGGGGGGSVPQGGGAGFGVRTRRSSFSCAGWPSSGSRSVWRTSSACRREAARNELSEQADADDDRREPPVPWPHRRRKPRFGAKSTGPPFR